MTPEQWADATVRIATGLLGWEEVDKDDLPDGFNPAVTWLQSADVHDDWVHWGIKYDENDPFPFDQFNRQHDFTTLDGCAEFERELARRGWLHRYIAVVVLCSIHDGKTHRSDAEVALLAAPADRVRACLRVMEEAGLIERHSANGAATPTGARTE